MRLLHVASVQQKRLAARGIGGEIVGDASLNRARIGSGFHLVEDLAIADNRVGQSIAASLFFQRRSALPPDFSLNGGVCGNNGRFQVTFNGDADSPEQNYALTLAATNGTTDSPLLQTFIIDVSRHLGITSPGSLDGTAGFPVNFQVTTTGFPPPSLSFSSGLLNAFPGLTFTDNGNGTGTLGGTPTVPGTVFCPIINGKAGCGVVASSSQGTVIQAFLINLAPAPPASLGLPTQATFVAGAKNSVMLTSTGASTHVVWKSRSGPSWLTLLDNGNGTAILQGTPPAGTSGTFSTEVAPIAAGFEGIRHSGLHPVPREGRERTAVRQL